jgi:hypothetical protein
MFDRNKKKIEPIHKTKKNEGNKKTYGCDRKLLSLSFHKNSQNHSLIICFFTNCFNVIFFHISPITCVSMYVFHLNQNLTKVIKKTKFFSKKIK